MRKKKNSTGSHWTCLLKCWGDCSPTEGAITEGSRSCYEAVRAGWLPRDAAPCSPCVAAWVLISLPPGEARCPPSGAASLLFGGQTHRVGSGQGPGCRWVRSLVVPGAERASPSSPQLWRARLVFVTVALARSPSLASRQPCGYSMYSARRAKFVIAQD